MKRLLICSMLLVLSLPAPALEEEYSVGDWYNKSVEFYLNESYDLALLCIDKTLDLQSSGVNTGTILAAKGRILNGLGRYEEAIECFNKAVEFDDRESSNPYTWVNKGFALDELGRHDEAITCYDEAIKIYPLYPHIFIVKGNTYLDLKCDTIEDSEKHYYEAIECYDNAIDIDPGYVLAWFFKNIAIRNRYAGIHNTGIVLYFRATRNESVEFYDSTYSESTELYNISLNYFEKAIEIDSQYADFWNEASVTFDEDELQQMSIECYENTTSLAVDWHFKGLALQALHRDAEAKVALDKAEEMGFSPPDAAEWW